MASPFPILTERLILRPFRDDDLEAMVAIYGREDVNRYLDWGPRSRDDVREWLGRFKRLTDITPRGDALRLAALLKVSDSLIGDFSVWRTSREHLQGEIGFVVHPDHQGKGYAVEAATVMLRMGFERLGFHRIAGQCDPRNAASASLMERLGMEEGVPIEHRLITRAIRNAQEKVEAHNFDIRKHLLEYDDVLNKQREVIYTRRRDLLSREDLRADVLELAEGIAEDLIATHADADTASEEWDWKAIDDAVFAQFNFRLNLPEEQRAGLRVGALQDILVERIRKVYELRETTFGAPIMRHLEKLIMLQTLDALWKDHLLNMDHLKEGIGLRGYGQVNPLQAYQKEGYDMFEDMIRRMDADVTEKLMSVQLRTEAAGARPLVRVEGMEDEALPAELEAMERRQRQTARVTLSHGGPAAPEKIETVRRDGDKVGRNDPCPCGSGKKYKKCHGRA